MEEREEAATWGAEAIPGGFDEIRRALQPETPAASEVAAPAPDTDA